MYRIAICDDEQSCLAEITKILDEYQKDKKEPLFSWNCFRTSFELLEAAQREAYDLYFLDIYIDSKNGIEIAKEIRSNDSQSKIVFLTSSDAFYKEAFKIKAEEYLEKPLVKIDFYQMLDRICVKEKENYLLIKESDEIRKISASDILYITSEGHYKRLVTKNEAILIRKTMKELIDELALDWFYSPNGKYIVNAKKIKKISKEEMIMENGVSLPLPRGEYRHVGELFAKYSF